MEIAKELGFTAMICTVTDDNAVQKHLLEKYGWEKKGTILNKRTGNVVLNYQYNLENFVPKGEPEQEEVI
jgi:hypothetical protein